MKPEPPFTLGVDVAGTVVSAPGLPGSSPASASRPSAAGAARRSGSPCRPSFTFAAARRHVVRRGCGAADELPHRRVRAARARRPARRRDRAGARRRRRPRHRDDPGRQGHGRAPSSASSAPRPRRPPRTQAGADHVVLLDGFKDAVKELTGGDGVDVVADIVGGDAFTDSLRSLATQGRLLVLGFASGAGHPRGQGQPAAAQQRRRARRRLGRLRDGAPGLHAGAVVAPACR